VSIGSTESGVAVTPAPARRRSSGGLIDGLAVGLTAALGLVHALIVATHYHVGSFDDDASYIMTARAIAHGTGFGGTLPAGYPLISTYPPGFAILLSPVALVAGSATWPYRALVLVFFVALFPLTHLWLRRIGAPRWLAIGVLLLLALNPVVATYATMVMVEAPFMAAVLATGLLADRWAADRRAFTAAGVGTVVLAAVLIYLKEAGVGIVAGLALWLVLRRRWRRALTLLAAVVVAFLPVLAYRMAVGTPLAGSRYSSEIGGNLSLSAIPTALHEYAVHALPRSVVPLVGVPGLFEAVYVTVPVFCLLGAVVWLRRYREPAALMTLVYLAETLVYPYINERRIVLVLPVVLAFYLTGAHQVLRWLAAALGRWLSSAGALRALAAVGAVLLVVPLAWQLDRNYRFDAGQDTSKPLGSPYLAFTAAVTGPHDVVETPYLWTTSLDTGRRATNGLFVAPCDEQALKATARADGAGFAVDAAFNIPPPLRDCAHRILDTANWAVPLYHTRLDDAVVHEFVGPGTTHPALEDAVSGPGVSAAADGGTAQTWTWSRPRRLTQLSVGAAAAAGGDATAVRLEWSDNTGQWHTATSARGPVGSDEPARFLLWQRARPVAATGVRVVVQGGNGIRTADVHALTAGEQ
jgi:Glycosyltransferase family 87